jgi:hypothetical protein
LIRANGFRVASLGGNGTADFGTLSLYYSNDPGAGQNASLPFRGCFAFLPHAGEWIIRRGQFGPAPNSPVQNSDLVHFTVFDGFSVEHFNALVSDVTPYTAISTPAQVSAAGSPLALSAAGAADLILADGSVISQGNYFHIVGASITNSGAGSSRIHLGRGDLSINEGYQVAAGTRLDLFPGTLSGLSSVYFLVTLGGTANVTWFVK